MGAIRLVGWARVRERWPTLLRLGLAAGLVLGAVLSISAVGRRTATALDRLSAVTNLEDVRVSSFYGPGVADPIGEFDGVVSTSVDNVVVGRPDLGGVVYLAMLSPTETTDRLSMPRVVEGRAADPTNPTEVTVDPKLAEELGIEIGDTIDYRMLTVEQFRSFGEGFGEPAGPEVPLEVVGFAIQPSPTPDLEGLSATPAFNDLYGDANATGELVRVRLRDGQQGVAAFEEQVADLASRTEVPDGAEGFPPFEVEDPETQAAPVRATTRILVVGLVATAALVALGAGVALTQALVRHHSSDRGNMAIQRGLGMSRREVTLSGLGGGAVMATVASTTAAAVGVLTSWIEPIGSIRALEPSVGWRPDVPLLVSGAVIVGAVVVTADLATAWWDSRRVGTSRSRRARPAHRIEVSNVPATVGLWLASEAGDEPTPVPVRSATAGIVLGIAGMVAALVVGASLHRLVTTPERYGWSGSFTIVDSTQDSAEMADVLAGVTEDDEVEALAVERAATVLIDGRPVEASELEVTRGSFSWTWLEGRRPDGPSEIALGPRLARDLGVAIGDEVAVSTPDGTAEAYAVTGLGLGPRWGMERLGQGAQLGSGGLGRVAADVSSEETHVRLRPAVDVEQYVAPLREQVEISEPSIPSEIGNLAQVERLPGLLAILMGIVAVAAIANVATVGVRRRRRGLGVLRAMGLTRPQVRRSILIASGFTTAKGLIIGVPIGLLLGMWVWNLIADASVVAGDAMIPATLVLVVPAALLTALVITVVPAWAAPRHRPAADLRAE